MANYPYTNYQQMPYGQYQQPFIPGNQPFTNQAQSFFQQQAQPQNIAQPTALAGRLVGGAGDITPNDVPTDGTIGYFPCVDGSVIYAKTWAGDGSIKTTEYVPKAPEAALEKQEPTFDAVVLERLDAIEQAIAELKPKPRTTAKKAVDTDA